VPVRGTPGAIHGDMKQATTVPFRVQVLSKTRAVLAVGGRLDAVTALALKTQVQDMIRGGRTEIVCDLTEVRLLDSSGLAALITSVKAARERGGFFRLAAVNDRVAHLFRITMLDHVFEIHPWVEDALGRRTDEWPLARVA